MKQFSLPVILSVSLVISLPLSGQSSETTSPLPLVKIVATGGTIANTPDGRISAEAVIRDVPEIADYARVEILDHVRIGSSSMSPRKPTA